MADDSVVSRPEGPRRPAVGPDLLTALLRSGAGQFPLLLRIARLLNVEECKVYARATGFLNASEGPGNGVLGGVR